MALNIMYKSQNPVIDYSITWIHPSGASMRPIWIPVSVSYSFWITGPIFSIPLGKQISLPWSLIFPTDVYKRQIQMRVDANPAFIWTVTKKKFTNAKEYLNGLNALMDVFIERLMVKS